MKYNFEVKKNIIISRIKKRSSNEIFYSNSIPERIEFSVENNNEFKEKLASLNSKEIFDFQLGVEKQIDKNTYSWCKGFCSICNKEVIFSVYNIKDPHENNHINWRENFICTGCGFSNRTRYLIKFLKNEVNTDKDIYITEQVTMLYNYLCRDYKNIIGSEYISDKMKSGTVSNGILHEDMMNLSFNERSFDCVISLDVLEHVTDYKKAIQEVNRVLRDNGMFVFSVPFLYNQFETQRRAQIIDGRINYLMEAEVHGNPMSEKGSLVFSIPGWDMIEYCRTLFSNVKVYFYYVPLEGHFAYPSGVPQILFKMIK